MLFKWKVDRKKSFENIVSLEILSESSHIRKDEVALDYLLPPAEQLYWTYQESFSHKLNIQKVSVIESKFLLKYYDLRMQSWIKEIANIVTQLTLTNPESSNLSYYSFVLPLLYLSEKNLDTNTSNSLFAIVGSGNLDIMSDFCLLRLDRPKVAFAIAKYKVKFYEFG